MIVLRAQQVIDEHDGDGGARDDHDAIAEEKKAEHVVDAVEPQAVHDEIELDEDGAKGEEADKKHGGKGTEVGRRRRDLAGNLIRADGGLECLGDVISIKMTGCAWERRRAHWLLEAQPASRNAERQADQEPNANNNQHRRKRDRAAGTLAP